MAASRYKQVSVNGKNVTEHRVLAAKALGAPLPEGTQVHHFGSTLILCQDAAYHNLLHRRQRALAACGNANWRKCKYCKEYDDPANVYINGGAGRHRWCFNHHRRELRRSKREKLPTV